MTLSKKSWLALALAVLLLVCGFSRGALAFTDRYGYGYYDYYRYYGYYGPYDPGCPYPGGYNYFREYKITPSSGSYNGTGTLQFTVENVPSKYLDSVIVDGVTLREGRDYSVSTIKLDSTLLLFLEDYLCGLDLGVHRVVVRYTQGEVRTYINVNPNPDPYGRSNLYHYNPEYRPSTELLIRRDAVALREVTVYEEPSSKSDKLGSYLSGTTMQVTGFTSSGTYATVRFGSGVGYVRGDDIRTTLGDVYTGVTSGKAYLYTAKSTSSKYRYAQVEKGAVLTLVAREGSYWQVNFGGELLYIQAKSVKTITVG